MLVLPKVEVFAAANFEGAAPASESFVIEDDPANPATSAVHFESETLLKIDLAKGLLGPGIYDVRVTNPDNTTVATWARALAIVPAPEVQEFDAKLNALACLAESEQTRTIKGNWFARVDGISPTLRVGDTAFEVTAMDGCTPVVASIGNKLELCTSLTFTLPKDSLPVGVYKVGVTNPGPVGCSASSTLDLAIVPPPKVLDLIPSAFCDDGVDKTFTIEGEGFLAFDGKVTTVTIGGMPAALVGAPMDCTVLAPAFPDVQTCNQLVVTFSKSAIFGEYEVGVKNPEPVACSAVAANALSVAPVPTVTSIAPTKICSGGGPVTVTGSGFWVDSKMNAPTVELVPSDNGVTIAAAAVQCLDCDPANNKPGTQLEVQFGSGTTPGVIYTVKVTNSGGCVATGPLPTLNVEVGPTLFLADPFVVPNQINTRVTLYATKLSEPLPTPAAWIIPAGMMAPQIDMVALPIDPAFPKRLQVIVPKGTPAGLYDVYLKDGSTCAPTMLQNGITVTDKEDLSILSVTPGFGAVATNTAIALLRNSVTSKANFIATPRVYLNPAKSTNPPADAKSILLGSTSFLDANQLTAVVPAGTPAGLYDVLVVNPEPTAEVGILYDGYASVTAPPPVIINAVPPSITAQANQPVELQGDDFRANAKVTASCVNASKQPVAAPMVISGMPSCNMAGKACTLVAGIDGGALGGGFVCILRVTNVDNTFGDYSAIGVTNSSLNIETPTAGTDMLIARRGLGSAAAKPTATARFLYAIAGDDGTAANTRTDVEFVPVDLYGTMGKTWSLQRNGLAQKRAFFGTAQTSRYVYVVGGTSNGDANALQSAERAQVLDPLEAPVIVDVDFTYDSLGVSGVLAGEWIYRVAAEFKDTDPHNPGGQGLASDPLIIKVPSGSKLGITIFWKAPVTCEGNPLPNIDKYHVYRTPTAGSGSGTEQEIAVVDGDKLSYLDKGETADQTKTPLVLGSTGRWHALPNLGNGFERNGVSAVIGVDPATPLTKRYLYAMFGRNTSAVLGTYQFLPITVDTCGHETVANAWALGANTSTARMNHMTWLVDRSVRTDVGPTTNFIYAGGGLNNTGAQVQTVVRAKVAAGGDIGSFTTTQSLTGGGITGAGVLAAAQQLFAFGGQQGMALSIGNKGVSAPIVDTNGNLASNSWNSGLNLLNPRAFMGSSVQSAFAFFIGGQTPNMPATKTTESVVW